MGLTRRLLAAALVLGLGGASAPAASPSRPLAGVRTWVVYYAAAPEAAVDLARFDVVVLDPHAHPPLPLVKRHGSLLLTYVSLGEVNTSHPEFAAIASEPWVLSPNPSWPDARRLDVRAPAYERWLLDRVVPGALAGPVNGLFLDTADTALDLERADPRALQGRGPGARARARGDEAPPPAGAAHDQRWSPHRGAAPDRAGRGRARVHLDRLRFQGQGLPGAAGRRGGVAGAAPGPRGRAGPAVFTLEYTAADRGAPWPAELIRRSRARGFIPYVSTIGLDQVSTHTLAP